MMNRLDQLAWLLFLIVLGGATVFLLALTSLAIFE
jgi:hypothetical protein